MGRRGKPWFDVWYQKRNDTKRRKRKNWKSKEEAWANIVGQDDDPEEKIVSVDYYEGDQFVERVYSKT